MIVIQFNIFRFTHKNPTSWVLSRSLLKELSLNKSLDFFWKFPSSLAKAQSQMYFQPKNTSSGQWKRSVKALLFQSIQRFVLRTKSNINEIQDETIIASAIELYRRWLLEPDHKPKVLKDDSKQFFFQTILKHCSLLFQVRKLDRETCEKHARLCSKVLTLYLAVAREQQKSITTESWEVWLKLLVGIAEGMFRAQPGDELLGQLLATQTLKVTTVTHN